jgi:putative DNA primase/helicase
VKRPSERQARLMRVSREDQDLAIAGALMHGARFGVRPEHFPDALRRAVLEEVLRARDGEGRDVHAVARLVIEAIDARGLGRAEEVLAAALEFSQLEAPMRPHELERNARHLGRAAKYARLVHELERARESGEHRLEAELAGKLSDLEEGEREGEELEVVKASDLEEKPTDWLWLGYFLAGQLNLFVSAPKCGKSTVTAMLAATVSKGAPWPVGSHLPSQEFSRAELGDVVMVCYEDDLQRTVLPRLIAAGADMERIHFVRGIRRPQGRAARKASIRPVDLADHFENIAALIQRTGARLLVIDPVMSGFSAGRDTNADNEVRAVLGPFVALAEETRVSVVFVTHTSKRGEGPALDLAIGSRAFGGLCRAVIGLEKYRDGTGRRVLVPIAVTSGKPRPGLVLEIRSEEGNEARSYVEFLEEFDGDMDDFRAEQRKFEREARQESADGKLAECKAAMLEVLGREKWLPSNELLEMLQEARGFSKRTSDRARRELRDERRIEIERRGSGASFKWWTGLTGADPQSSTHVQTDQTERIAAARARGLAAIGGERL